MRKVRILLDMDEVLVDFVGGACRLFGVSKRDVERHHPIGEWDMVPPLGKALKEKYGTPTFNTNDFWRKIDEAGQWFWDGLEAMPWQSELLALVESITDDWFIVSAPSWCPSSFSGKVKYLKRVFGKRFDRFLLTPHKTLFANESAVLIDDRESNIQKFVEAGGEGILFPTYHNCLHEKRDDPMSFIREKLEEVCCALQV